MSHKAVQLRSRQGRRIQAWNLIMLWCTRAQGDHWEWSWTQWVLAWSRVPNDKQGTCPEQCQHDAQCSQGACLADSKERCPGACHCWDLGYNWLYKPCPDHSRLEQSNGHAGWRAHCAGDARALHCQYSRVQQASKSTKCTQCGQQGGNGCTSLAP